MQLDLGFQTVSRSLRQRTDAIVELQRRFDQFDVIIGPAAVGPAFHHNHQHAPIDVEGQRIAYVDYCMPFSVIYNYCGNPVLVVPGGMSREGLPIGFAIAAAHYMESELIHFGRLVEQIGFRFMPPQGS